VIDKIVGSEDEAVADIVDGSTVLVGGFGGAGVPSALLAALERRAVRDLTVVANNAGSGHVGLAALVAGGMVRRVICSFPRAAQAIGRDGMYQDLEIELCPQGTLAERIRAGGAGIGGFYTRSGAGTELAAGKEVRVIDGHEHVLERPIKADFALIRARQGDRWGNLVYSKSGRNFGPDMATAATVTIAEVDQVVPLGSLDPECVVTPGVFVNRIVEVKAGP
jgi:3-oxoadipate CoA-transferase alpha subunit